MLYCRCTARLIFSVALCKRITTKCETLCNVTINALFFFETNKLRIDFSNPAGIVHYSWTRTRVVKLKHSMPLCCSNGNIHIQSNWIWKINFTSNWAQFMFCKSNIVWVERTTVFFFVLNSIQSQNVFAFNYIAFFFVLIWEEKKQLNFYSKDQSRLNDYIWMQLQWNWVNFQFKKCL